MAYTQEHLFTLGGSHRLTGRTALSGCHDVNVIFREGVKRRKKEGNLGKRRKEKGVKTKRKLSNKQRCWRWRQGRRRRRRRQQQQYRHHWQHCLNQKKQKKNMVGLIQFSYNNFGIQ